MIDSTFEPSPDEQIAVSLAYIAYSGSDIPRHLFLHPDRRILDLIETTMPRVPVLRAASGEVDWRVVWGPAIYSFELSTYQDNAMFVVERISRPSEYLVVIRGTNGIALLDWIEEDLRVFHKVDWEVPGGIEVHGRPQISKATQIGLNALLNKLRVGEGLPGAGQDLGTFLTGVADSGSVDIRFTGHSLGGALAPTLALWFRQCQGLQRGWDPASNASISTISFAGPSAGNVAFAELSDALLGDRCERIHNTLDIVPLGWDTATLSTLPALYLAGGITMNLVEKAFLGLLLESLHDYRQIERSKAATWAVQPGSAYDGFFKQAETQHFDAYPILLGLPELTGLIQRL